METKNFTQAWWHQTISERVLPEGERGFTTIELVVVIAIMGLMLGLAIPAFSVWRSEYSLKKAATDLFSHMQWARARAIKGNTQWAIVFIVTPGSERYLVCSSSGADSDWSTIADNTVERTVRLSEYGGDIAFGHGDASDDIPGNGSPPADDVTYTNDMVIFNSSGFSNPGYVYIQNNRGDTYGLGTRSTGIVFLRKWNRGNSRWE